MTLSWVMVWLEKFSLALLALIGGILTAWLAPWLQDRRRARREHLNAIKARVFRPLLAELEQLYLPLLRGELGPVTLETVPVRVGDSITDPQIIREYRLVPRFRIGDYPPPLFLGQREEEAPELDLELYEDAKRHHFRCFIGQLEAFKAEVDAYLAQWVSYAEDLSRAIAERVELPVLTTVQQTIDAVWASVKGLAVFLVNRQLGQIWQPMIAPNGRSLQVAGDTMVKAEGKETTMEHVLKVLEELFRERQRVDELRREAEPLLDQARSLVTELRRLLQSSKLPGGCQLAEVSLRP